MSEVVLDASALLAYLNEEPGAEAVEQALAQKAYISTANWAEVLSKVTESGVEPEALIHALKARCLLGQTLEVLSLLAEDSLTVAKLYSVAQAAGLPLGDQACLALGFRLALPVLTTDREWQKLPVNIEVRVVC